MTLKNEIKNSLGNKEEKIELRLSSAKVIFILMTLIFFLLFFFSLGGILKEESRNILSPVYLLFILSLNLYLFFLFQKIFANKKAIGYIASGIFFLISIFFILIIFL